MSTVEKDHVANKKVAGHLPIRETEMSKKGAYYEAANGTPIWNEGERDVAGESEDGQPLGLTFQVAEVKGPIASVRRICQEGNLVIFDSEGGVIVNKESGQKTRFTLNEKGIYALNIWVKKSSFTRQEK